MSMSEFHEEKLGTDPGNYISHQRNTMEQRQPQNFSDCPHIASTTDENYGMPAGCYSNTSVYIQPIHTQKPMI